MARNVEELGILTIAGGAQQSNVISSKVGLSSVIDLLILSLSQNVGGFEADAFENDAFEIADIASGDAVSVLVAGVDNPADSDFVVLQVGGSDLQVPVGKATQIPVIGFRALRVRSAAAELAARTFRVLGQVDIGHGGMY